MDFICKPNKKGKQVPRIVRVDYDVNEVQKSAVWNGVIQADSKWAFARENSYKRALTECLEKETHYRNEAEGLKNYIRENFTDEKVYADFVEILFPTEEVELSKQIEEMFSDLSL